MKYNASERNILLSGDIELYPGPTTTNTSSSQMMCREGSNSVFNSRLRRYGLRALEVGGNGNCLFRAIAHQIYGDANRHLEIRRTGVQYFQNNPNRFIESAVVDNTSWYAPAWLPVTIHSSAYYLPFCCFLSSLAWIVNGNPPLKIFTTVNKLDFGFQPTLHRIV